MTIVVNNPAFKFTTNKPGTVATAPVVIPPRSGVSGIIAAVTKAPAAAPPKTAPPKVTSASGVSAVLGAIGKTNVAVSAKVATPTVRPGFAPSTSTPGQPSLNASAVAKSLASMSPGVLKGVTSAIASTPKPAPPAPVSTQVVAPKPVRVNSALAAVQAVNAAAGITSGHMTDRLMSNQQLTVNEFLQKQGPAGSGLAYKLIMQPDGGLVLYKYTTAANSWTATRDALWSTGGTGANRVIMQKEGNLCVYGDGNRLFWSTDNGGHPGAAAYLLEDGNFMVLGPAKSNGRNDILWESRTWGGVPSSEHDSGGVIGFLGDVVSTAGRAIGAVTEVIADGAKGLADLAGQIPLIGPGLEGVLTIASGPFTFTNAILQGERIDHALLDDLKDKVHGISQIAPYVQTVISFMPGIGTGIAGAIGAATALAQGMPLTQALIAGFKQAVPGGMAGQALFSLTVSAVSGDNMATATANAALGALNLPPQVQGILQSSLKVAYSATQGNDVPMAALQEARENLPVDLQGSFDIAVAVGQGKRLQDSIQAGLKNMTPEQLAAIAKVGVDQMGLNSALGAGADILDAAQRGGYQLGVGLLSHTGVNSAAVTTIRTKLTAGQKQGFDIGLAARVGAVVAPPPPDDLSDKSKAAYLVTNGMVGANGDAKAGMMGILAKDPDARPGAVVAINALKKKGLWTRILEFLHLKKKVD